MFDEKTLAERDDDAAILALFREWRREVEWMNAADLDDDAMDEQGERVRKIEEIIAATPTAGIVGFVIKFAIQYQYEHGCWEDEENAGPLDALFRRALLNEAAHFVPDLVGFFTRACSPPPARTP